MKLILNDEHICTINSLKYQNLKDLRNFLKNKINSNFYFLDTNNDLIHKKNEKKYTILDITKDNVIKIEKDKNQKTHDMNSIDLSKYEIYETENNLTIYKYSNIERISHYNLVHEYYYDFFDENDHKNSCIALFVGKSGDGKTKAINAIFNIIKGIKLEDNYRFILINETTKKNNIIQTKGIHIYYVKDYNNKPIILIDSPGFYQGREADNKLNKTFCYVLNNLIDHINICFFVIKADVSVFDNSYKYVFNCITNLFHDDIMNNFILLATHADKHIIKKKPDIMKCIEKVDNKIFHYLRKNKEKWLYAIDSNSLFDSDIDNDKLIRYSYEQIKELFEEIFKKLKPIYINERSQLIKSRKQLTIKYKKLYYICQNLIIDEWNLEEKEKQLSKNNEKIKEIETIIINCEKYCSILDKKDMEKYVKNINEKIIEYTNYIKNEKIKQYIKICEIDNNKINTYCNNCKRNCHINCDCLPEFLCEYLCTPRGICLHCGCISDYHKRGNYFFIYKKVLYNINGNDDNNQNNLENKQIDLESNKINEFCSNIKNKLLYQKNENINEKKNIQNKRKKVLNEIIYIIIELVKIQEELESMTICSKYNQNKIIDYIESLIYYIKDIEFEKEEYKKAVEKILENLKIFMDSNNLSFENLLEFKNSQSNIYNGLDI